MCIRDRSWTYERVEKLKQLWEEGLTASRIAAELGEVTRNAVIGKAHRLGLSGRMASKKSNGGISIIRKKRVNISQNQKVINIAPVINEPMNPTDFENIKDGLCRWPLGEPEEIEIATGNLGWTKAGHQSGHQVEFGYCSTAE